MTYLTSGYLNGLILVIFCITKAYHCCTLFSTFSFEVQSDSSTHKGYGLCMAGIQKSSRNPFLPFFIPFFLLGRCLLYNQMKQDGILAEYDNSCLLDIRWM